MRHRTASSLFALLGTCLLSTLVATGCMTDAPEGPERAESPNFGVTAAALATSDVAKFEFVIRRCSGGVVTRETRSLQPIGLPGGIGSLEGKPYDKDSEHAFADFYSIQEAGCYDVKVKPLKSNNTQSNKCDVSVKEDIDVEDGETTEVMLISQCKGPKKGGLDVMGSLNHPPEIKYVKFFPSKFVKCPERVKICVAAKDPDDDPLKMKWKVRGPATITQPHVVERKKKPGYIKKCIAFKPGHGDWKIWFKAWDLLHYKGKKIKVEKYLKQVKKCQQHADMRCESRDEIHFPLYGAKCAPGKDVGLDGAIEVGGPDTGQPPADTGQPPADTGQPPADTGQPPADTGQPDTGQPDAGQPVCGNGIVEQGEECDGQGQAQCSSREVCVNCQCIPDQQQCVRTLGYWGQHHETSSNPSQRADWPAPEDENNLLCGQTWLSILNTAPGQSPLGEKWAALARQWIPAKLNVAAGASTTSTVAQALSDAQTLLTGNCNGLSLSEQTQATNLTTILDEFNNGLRGNPKCNGIEALCGPGYGNCVSTKYCDFPDAQCGQGQPGTCDQRPNPNSCSSTIDFVCGCNGTTYLNACQARLAGTDVDHSGACNGLLFGN